MKLARVVVCLGVIIGTSPFILSQTSSDLENGFQNYGSYHGSDIDAVNLLNGNLMVHIPMPWTYPQRGSAILPKNLLTMSSKTWQIKCVPMDPLPAACFWTVASFRDQMVSLAGSGLGFDHTMDLSLHRAWSLNTDFQGNPTYFSGDYSLFTADGASHSLVPRPNAPLDTNGDRMTYDSNDTSGFHIDLSSPDATDGTPTVAIVTDRHGNIYQGDWFTSFPCRTTKASNGGLNEDLTSTKQCSQATTLSSVTDTNGNVFTGSLDTMGRPFHAYTFVSSGPDTNGCVLNGLTFSSSSIFSYAGPNGATNQVKMCYATVNIATAFGVSGVSEAQNATNLGSPSTAQVLVTAILPDGSKWVFNYDSYVNLTYIGLPTGGSISYTWQTLNIATPCDKISRAVATRTLNDNIGHSYKWNYQWGLPAGGSQSNVVTDPLLNDTVHNFTDFTGHNSCPHYETKTQQFLGSSGSNQLLKQVDTTYSLTGVGAVPTNIKTTLLPSNKVSLITRSYDLGLGPNQPIFGNVIKESQYDWGQNSPGALLRETDTTYEWQKDSRYLTAHLLDLPASIVVISPNPSGNPKTNCPSWDSNGSAITTACMAETDYTYDESAYLTGYEATVGALPTGTHVAAPNPVRGNLTTVSRWLNTTNSFLVSHTNWYDTGEPHLAIDPLGHTTTNSYDPAYAGAYSTQTCNAKSQCVSGLYDFQTGALTSLTDANNATSTYGYDTFGRLIDVLSPADASGAHPHSHFTLSDGNVFPPTITRQQWITSSLIDTSTHLLDGLGRNYQTKHTMPTGSPAIIDTVFDGLDHVISVSNPYFTTSDSTYGLTQTLYDGLGRAYQVTKEDGSVSSVDYSAGNCTLTTDETQRQRKGCSDALGRLVEVDEPNPSPVAHVVINGNEQTNPQPGASGTGWVTIAGTEGMVINDPCAEQPPLPGHPPRSCPTTTWDTGSLTATVNGFSKTAGYGQGSTAASMALDLASQFHVDTASPVDAAVDPANSAKVNFGARGVGVATNYSLQLSPGGDFGFNSSSGAAFTGGRDATTNPDTGSVTVTVNGVGYSTSYGGADSDGSGIASRLASLVSAGPYANASAASNTVSLTGKASGPPGGYSLSANYSWNTTSFGQPSFTTSSDASLSNIGNSPYVTLYQYDALGNLLRVDQKGSAPTDSTQWRTRMFTYDSLSRPVTATNPESGSINYLYDADGELLMKTSPAPNPNPPQPTQSVSYCYDELHRVTKRDYQSHTFSPPSCPITTPVVSYTYDSGTNAIGHLTSLADQAGTAANMYDILGRLTTATRPIAGVSKSTSYTYNLDGSVKTLTYPSGRVLTYTLDSAGRLLSAVDGNGTQYVSNATYYPNGSEYQHFMPGIYFRTDLNSRLQVIRYYSDNGQVNSFFIDKTYNYGPLHQNNGNLVSIANNKDSTRTRTFAYDALNRITSGSSSANSGTYSWGESYSIDAWGNLQISPMGGKVNGGSFQLSGNVQNRPTGLAYDAAGNLMSYLSATYTYDQENRLSSTAGTGYTYDGDGERVLKFNTSTGAPVKRYWSMGGNTLSEGDGSGNLTAEYIYFGGKRVARIDLPANTVHYYISDQLGSTSIVASATGAVEEESDYSPYGSQFPPNSGLNHYKFTGKERDTESNIDYFGARYLNSLFGRFTSPDDGSDQSTSDPQSWNLYGYVRNNPISNTDPDGHDCVVQTRTGDHTESVSVTPGNCDKVKVGDGQSKTYVPGTVDPSSIRTGSDGHSIEYSFRPYNDPSVSGVGTAPSAPFPDRAGLAYGLNANGYRTLGSAGATMTDGRTYALWTGASALAAGCVLGCPTAGTALLNAGRLLYYAAAGILPAVPSAVEKLQKLGMSVPEANEIIENPATQRFIDNANNGNINYFADVGGKIVRITTDPSGQRIISAGIVQARNIANGIATGRFTK